MNEDCEKPSLAVGPMSSEIIESVFRYSHFHRTPLYLISSKNQVDHSRGYVNAWNTREYMEYVQSMRTAYQNSEVTICRDHCGPGFNGNYDMKDVYKTIETDIENGFDLIHIDFCHFQGSREEQLAESKKAVEFCYKLDPNIKLEIGTDENTGASYSLTNLDEINDEIDYFQSFCSPEFFVVQTGTVVKEIGQAGSYNEAFVRDVSTLLKSKGLRLKEHNADYLSRDEIERRNGVVDCMNNAPQFGVVQTSTVLTKALTYGINITDFINVVYEGGKWKKWMNNNSPENKMLCVLIAGHYHFNSDEYKTIISRLADREDIQETLIDASSTIIGHYLQQ